MNRLATQKEKKKGEGEGVSINQSNILINPHTGKEKPIPAPPQRVTNPASQSDAGLGAERPSFSSESRDFE